VISVVHLTRRFGGFLALDDISFDIGRGEIVGFLGPNGAGKTTTLRILAGYLPATSGVARVAGFDVLRQSLEVRRRIGYLAESVPLYREHRVTEMLEFQGRLHGISRAERARRIPRVLERVGLADRSRALIGSLSRGLRQRVGLALALLPEPEVLILDEPTSGLDPLQRIEVRGVIRELAERHTILLSSHILPEVAAVSARVIIIHKGRIAADGTREELVNTLARASHVRLEAMLGADAVETALRLLKSIPGVRNVVHRGRRGIHHDIDIQCSVDLREEAGALALQRGWALRELSWQRPTLEEIFARIALSLGDEADAQRAAPAKAVEGVAPAPVSAPVSRAMPLDVVAAPESAPPKVVYNLNPFDRGASRELGRPKRVDVPAPEEPAAGATLDAGAATRSDADRARNSERCDEDARGGSRENGSPGA
jgi:ABC-2 type transport system ATP-binding protein